MKEVSLHCSHFTVPPCRYNLTGRAIRIGIRDCIESYE